MKKIWITKDKQHIKIKDMTTSHIKNCVRMIETYYERREHEIYMSGLKALTFLNGEIAIQSVENGLNDLEENGYQEEKLDNFLEAFEHELSKRKEINHEQR